MAIEDEPHDRTRRDTEAKTGQQDRPRGEEVIPMMGQLEPHTGRTNTMYSLEQLQETCTSCSKSGSNIHQLDEHA